MTDITLDITGTITFTSGSAAIVGTGTLFTGHLAGDVVFAPDGKWYELAATPTSDLAATLDRNYAGTTATGAVGGTDWVIFKNSISRDSVRTATKQLTDISSLYRQIINLTQSDQIVKLSKATAADRAGLVVQKAGVDLAQVGTFGDDDLSLRYLLASTWTKALSVDTVTGATKFYSQLVLGGICTPATITADTNDYNPTGLAQTSTLRVATDASRTLTGIAGGAEGRVLLVANKGGNPLVLADQNSGSAAANRFAFGSAVTLSAGASVLLSYDAVAQRWCAIGSAGGGALTATSLTVTGDVGIDGNVNVGGEGTFRSTILSEVEGLVTPSLIILDGNSSHIQAQNTGGPWLFSNLTYGASDPTVPGFGFSKSTGTTPSTRGAISNGTGIYGIYSYGDDGSSLIPAASFGSYVDGPVSTGVMPVEIRFAPGTSGYGTISLRLRSSGVAEFVSNIASTSTTTGTITVAGGVGIAGALNVGGHINSATGFKLGGATILDVSMDYVQINNSEGNACIEIGNSADKTNYYENDVHVFWNQAFTAFYGSLDPTGLTLPAGKNFSVGGADSGLDLSNGSTITRRSSDGHVRYTSQNNVHEFVGAITASDQPGSRTGVYAAPFDAMAFNGLQVNGDMQIDQEHVGAAASPGAGRYALDGNIWGGIGTNGAFTTQRVTDAPAGFTNSLKAQVTTAVPSLASGDALYIFVGIEGYRVAPLAFGLSSANSSTVSFWVKGARTGTYGVCFNNSNWDRQFRRAFTINAANTWEYKTVTIPGDVTGTWNKANTLGLGVAFVFAAGSGFSGAADAWNSNAAGAFGITGQTNGMAATSDSFQITGVRVFPGTEAPSAARSMFVGRSFDTELALAQRYFEKSYPFGTAVGTVGTTGAHYDWLMDANNIAAANIEFKVRKSATPTFTFFSAQNGASGQGAMYNTSGVFQANKTMNSALIHDRGHTNYWVSSGTANNIMFLHWVANSRL